MKTKKLIKKLLIAAGYAVLFSLNVNCGYHEKVPVKKIFPLPLQSQSQMISIPVELVSQLAGFNLQSNYQFSFSLEGCDSGYHLEFTESNGEILVYESDTNCYVKLNGLEINGVTFHASEPFSSWNSGSQAVYESQLDPDHKLELTILSQLNSPVTDSDKVTFKFREIKVEGNFQYSSEDLKRNQPIDFVGSHAPAYELTEMLVLKKKKGQIYFKLYFNCLSYMDNIQDDPSCEGQLLNELTYTLTDANVITDIDFEEVGNQFAIKTHSGIDFIQDSILTPHGGFSITIKFSLKDIVANKKYVVFLKNAENSYAVHHISFE